MGRRSKQSQLHGLRKAACTATAQPAAPSTWKGHAARGSTRRTFFEPRRTTGGCLLHTKAVAAHGRQASPPTNQRREVAFKRPKTSINLHEPILRHHKRTPKTLPMLQVHQTPTNRSAPMSAPLPRGGGGILAEFRPPRWRTKGRRAASIEAGKGPSASGMTPNPTTAA